MLGQMVKFVGEVDYVESLNESAGSQKQTDNKKILSLRFIRPLDITEDRIKELDHWSIEIIQSERTKKKILKAKGIRVQKMDHVKDWTFM